jgi:hypothetical protein
LCPHTWAAPVNGSALELVDREQRLIHQKSYIRTTATSFNLALHLLWLDFFYTEFLILQRISYNIRGFIFLNPISDNHQIFFANSISFGIVINSFAD